MMNAIGLFLERFAALPSVIIIASFIVLIIIIGGPKLIESIIVWIEKKVAGFWEKMSDGSQEFAKWCGLAMLGVFILFAFLGVGQNACHSGSVDCGYYEER